MSTAKTIIDRTCCALHIALHDPRSLGLPGRWRCRVLIGAVCHLCFVMLGPDHLLRGRGQETPGESVALSKAYAAAYLQGLQGNHSRYLRVSAACKHWAGYSMEKSGGTDRHHFVAKIAADDWADTYSPVFEHCVVTGRASGFMCSYNAVLIDGAGSAAVATPSCADGELLRKGLLAKWGFEGCEPSRVGLCSPHDTPNTLFSFRMTSMTSRRGHLRLHLDGCSLLPRVDGGVSGDARRRDERLRGGRRCDALPSLHQLERGHRRGGARGRDGLGLRELLRVRAAHRAEGRHRGHPGRGERRAQQPAGCAAAARDVRPAAAQPLQRHHGRRHRHRASPGAGKSPRGFPFPAHACTHPPCVSTARRRVLQC